MAIEIVPATAELTPAVYAFNDRMEAGGSGSKFYQSPIPNWLAPAAGASAHRAHYLAVNDAKGTVHGGYVLKTDTFLIDGVETQVGNTQGPISEGIVSPRLAALGVVMMRDSVRRLPEQFGWGSSARKAALLQGLGWRSQSLPILLHVAHKSTFLRKAILFRRGGRLELAAKLAAFSGLGPVGISLAQFRPFSGALRASRISAVQTDTFGPWADEVWVAARRKYRFIAIRDAAALNRAMPPGDWPNVTPLRVEVDGAVVGWAGLRLRQLDDEPQFAGTFAGSVVDALARPGCEAVVVRAAKAALLKAGVDFIGAVFSHPDWDAAFRAAGFLRLPGRRSVSFSHALEGKLSLEAGLAGGHLTLMDGDGPHSF